MLKQILNNRFFQFAIAFLAGGFAMQVFGPEKTITKTQVIVQEKVVTIVKEVIKHDNTQTHTVTTPDGTTITDTTTISTTTDNSLASATEHATSNISEKIVTNPKRFHIYAGVGGKINGLNVRPQLIGGFDTTLWGPFTIGAQVSTATTVGVTLGLRW